MIRSSSTCHEKLRILLYFLILLPFENEFGISTSHFGRNCPTRHSAHAYYARLDFYRGLIYVTKLRPYQIFYKTKLCNLLRYASNIRQAQLR